MTYYEEIIETTKLLSDYIKSHNNVIPLDDQTLNNLKNYLEICYNEFKLLMIYRCVTRNWY